MLAVGRWVAASDQPAHAHKECDDVAKGNPGVRWRGGVGLCSIPAKTPEPRRHCSGLPR